MYRALILALLLGAVPATAHAQRTSACAAGSVLRPGYTQSDGTYVPSQCYAGNIAGASVLQPGQLYPGGPVGQRRSHFGGRLGAGGSSIPPGEWYPQVAGQRINPGQLGAFYESQATGGYGYPFPYLPATVIEPPPIVVPLAPALPPAPSSEEEYPEEGDYAPPPSPERGGPAYSR